MSEKTDKIIKELGYKPAKSKKIQPQTDNIPQGRDLFQTPNYAIDLLIPYIPSYVKRVWECAAGGGKIARRLEHYGYSTFSSDLRDEIPCNFLTWNAKDLFISFDCIITNPPFSLKQKFYQRCLEYKRPFALLIPADYSGWIIDAVRLDGAEKIIPTRRIDYITPNILTRIHEGEIWENSKNFYMDKASSLEELKLHFPRLWEEVSDRFGGYCMWDSVEDAPKELLHKYSSSDFHSMWLTWGFNLGQTETFVELSNQEKKENI